MKAMVRTSRDIKFNNSMNDKVFVFLWIWKKIHQKAFKLKGNEDLKTFSLSLLLEAISLGKIKLCGKTTSNHFPQ